MNRRSCCLVVAALGLTGFFRPLAGQDSLRTRARQLVAENPRDAARRAALAQVLSWSPATRAEAAQHFAEALKLDSVSVEAWIGYADLLSWSAGTRDSASVLYHGILSRWPGELRARVGLANLLAWGGQPSKALRSYDSVLAESPDHQAALRGRGGRAESARAGTARQ